MEEAIVLRQGYQDNIKDKGKGLKHLKAHFEPLSEGYINKNEFVNLGTNIREFLKKYNEPFIDKRGARIYEWYNKEGTKFRVIVDSLRAHEAQQRHAQPLSEEIITFYSNRFTNKMKKFFNDKVEKDYNDEFNNVK